MRISSSVLRVEDLGLCDRIEHENEDGQIEFVEYRLVATPSRSSSEASVLGLLAIVLLVILNFAR